MTQKAVVIWKSVMRFAMFSIMARFVVNPLLKKGQVVCEVKQHF
jgi:hypothetical protein